MMIPAMTFVFPIVGSMTDCTFRRWRRPAPCRWRGDRATLTVLLSFVVLGRAALAAREAEWERFDRWVQIVCDKCQRRRVDCGCRLAEEGPGVRHRVWSRQHPAFDLLADFTEDMLQARARGDAGKEREAPARRVVLHLHKQGLGNQLLSLVNGLLLALLTKRTLAVHVHATQMYDLEPVLDVNAFANSLAAPCSTFFTIDLLDAAGMDWAMCGDLEALHDAECLVLEGAATDVHLWQVVHRCNRVLAWVHEHSHYSGSH